MKSLRVDFVMCVGAVLAALLLQGALYAAQEPPRRRPPEQLPGEGQGYGRPGPRDGERRPAGPPPGLPGFNFISPEMRLEGPPVKGAPYSATAVTESVQVLADGTRISRQLTASIWRDSEGRTRREQKMDLIGPLAPAGDPPTLIFINDVVAGLHYALDPRTRTARRLPLPRESERPAPVPAPPSDRVVSESLGRRVIEGIEAEGTKTTITIPAGEIGNDRPIEIVSERWRAIDLGVVVYSRHFDPRFGETTFRLTSIERSEPEASLFEVPVDYQITSERPPVRRQRRF